MPSANPKPKEILAGFDADNFYLGFSPPLLREERLQPYGELALRGASAEAWGDDELTQMFTFPRTAFGDTAEVQQTHFHSRCQKVARWLRDRELYDEQVSMREPTLAALFTGDRL